MNVLLKDRTRRGGAEVFGGGGGGGVGKIRVELIVYCSLPIGATLLLSLCLLLLLHLLVGTIVIMIIPATISGRSCDNRSERD